MWFTKSHFLTTGTHDTDSFTTETEYAGLGDDAKSKLKKAIEVMSAKHGCIEDFDSAWAEWSQQASSSGKQQAKADQEMAGEAEFVLLQDF